MGPLEWDSEDKMERLVKHHLHRMVCFNQTLDKVESRIAQYSDYATGWMIQGSHFLFSRSSRSGFGAHPASCAVGHEVISWVYCTWSVKLTAHLHPLPGLRIFGAVSVLTIHAFISLTVITLPLPMQKAHLECHHHHYHYHYCCCCCVRLFSLSFITIAQTYFDVQWILGTSCS